jgi:hypothetical protein
MLVAPVMVARKAFRPFEALEKEAKLGPALHAEVLGVLEQIQHRHPELAKVLASAAGFAVVPSIGRASFVVGGAYGVGEVFARDAVIGYGAIVELTIGLQLGGTTFDELVVFHDEAALERMKAGRIVFAADAGVALVKWGAQASRGYGAGTSVFVFDKGGMLVDLSIGAQRLVFKPAVLGRTRSTASAGGVKETPGRAWRKIAERIRRRITQTSATPTTDTGSRRGG